jgi:hypothetical protein
MIEAASTIGRPRVLLDNQGREARMFCTSIVLSLAMLTPSVVDSDDAKFPTSLEKWIAVDPPQEGTDAGVVANNDTEHEWVVTIRNGHPHVELHKDSADAPAPLPFKIAKGMAADGLAGRRFSAKVNDGWIVAFNAGEFGAGLWWFSPDGSRRDKISKARVKGFIETDNRLLALEGLAHLGWSRGRIIRLVQDPKGRWRSEDLVDLQHAPIVAAKRPDGSLLVATTDRLLRVVPSEKKIEILLKDAFWGALYPNSMVVSLNDTVYLGMRHGVAKIEKVEGQYKVSWLVPNKALADMRPRERTKSSP